MVTLEQVEKLRERANVSYDEAKEALEASGGDMLEALIYLEKQGKVKVPQGNGYYSSEQAAQGGPQAGPYRPADYGRGETFGSLMKRFGRFCLKVLHKGNVNTFEVLKGDESKASVPVTVLVLLLLFAFWVVLPLLIIGLFFGLRYRFRGPDLGTPSVNSAMDSVANAADDLKHTVTHEQK